MTSRAAQALSAIAPRTRGVRLADAETPLIRNCWYVAAWSSEVGRALLSRRLLGRRVVLFRTQAGIAVAMHDRCPHRSLPLSKGWLEGDAVRCAYHGLVFDCGGACIEAPPVGHVPTTVRVPTYPLIERGPLLWIWLGDAPADESALPDTSWLDDSSWAYAHGAMSVACNYVSLHENLLDLTHFTYLHPGNIGTPEYASAPYTVDIAGERVRVERQVSACSMPTIYSSSGLAPDARIWRRTMSEFLTPGLHAARGLFGPIAEDDDRSFEIRITHFVTPADQDRLHYYFTFARNFAVEDGEVTSAMKDGAIKAFIEDADALEAIADIAISEPGFREMSLKSDRAGIAMRRLIATIAEREQHDFS